MDRYKWRDAVLESGLTSTEKIVALVFEWHASQGTGRVWCAPERLQAMTSLGRTSCKSTVQRLVVLGWLTVIEKARQHRAARYALTIPSGADRDPLIEPRGSESDPLDESRGSLEDFRGSPDGARGSGSDPDPCSIPVLIPEESDARSKPESNGKGTRLPQDWTPSEELKAWTREHFPQLHGPTVADNFRDWYWAAPGGKGVRADWDATWRSWCRRESGDGLNPGLASRSGDRNRSTVWDLRACEPCGVAHRPGKHTKKSGITSENAWMYR